MGSLRSRVRPLRDLRDLDPLLERIGQARFVLLGEASHGTAEYYTWRSHLSQRLIREKGFSFVAVEGDWPDCDQINQYVKGRPDSGEDAREVLQAFERWPTWMWANHEILQLAEWMREHNKKLDDTRKVGFHGLDVYSLWDSLYQVMGYLRKNDPAALSAARRAFRCFEPFGEDAEEYARSTRWIGESCEKDVIALLTELRRNTRKHVPDGAEARFSAEQNALIVKNAEHYYRTMVRGGPDSWNVRDRHMVETLDRLMEFYGPEARAIVWAHNTHLGDARFTDMVEDGMVNVGQLVRQQHRKEEVVLVGFGSYRGTVIAGQEWDAPAERMTVPPGRPGSWEEILHQLSMDDKLLLFQDEDRTGPLAVSRGHRAIGVVYHPQYEKYGNYVPTVLPARYDAFLYLDHTEALHPLALQPHEQHEVPETFPSGV